uniref:Uncharacterized protein n=1 Tax=Anguilla anguilla TaxID=7936 RepID=A0A0E9TAA1_ANGAN
MFAQFTRQNFPSAEIQDLTKVVDVCFFACSSLNFLTS